MEAHDPRLRRRAEVEAHAANEARKVRAEAASHAGRRSLMRRRQRSRRDPPALEENPSFLNPSQSQSHSHASASVPTPSTSTSGSHTHRPRDPNVYDPSLFASTSGGGITLETDNSFFGEASDRERTRSQSRMQADEDDGVASGWGQVRVEAGDDGGGGGGAWGAASRNTDPSVVAMAEDSWFRAPTTNEPLNAEEDAQLLSMLDEDDGTSGWGVETEMDAETEELDRAWGSGAAGSGDDDEGDNSGWGRGNKGKERAGSDDSIIWIKDESVEEDRLEEDSDATPVPEARPTPAPRLTVDVNGVARGQRGGKGRDDDAGYRTRAGDRLDRHEH